MSTPSFIASPTPICAASADHTLQTTVLVHETYLRLVGQRNVQWQTRAHFFAIAARVMRNILVDHARGRGRAKRGEGKPEVQLGDVAVMSDERADELVAVNTALDGLTAIDPRKGRVFELRYFVGMSDDEAAEALKVFPATVTRDWRMARASRSKRLEQHSAESHFLEPDFWLVSADGFRLSRHPS